MNFDLGYVLGGFGLFMFGMKFMGDGLKSYCGSKMRDLIDKYTSNYFLGLLIGCLVTVIIQSSSATTVIAIGLIRAGLMKLHQATGILLGASIGTTITAFLIGLKIEQYALYFAFVGGMLLCFANKKKTLHFGEIIFGFGCLFYGLKIMGDALSQLVNSQYFMTINNLSHDYPYLVIIFGLIMTIILQSSSVTIGIVQKIYEASGISFLSSLMFVFGANIGTTITGYLASLGGSLSAKRAALFNVLFKVTIVVFFIIFIKYYLQFLTIVKQHLQLSPMMEIALAHMFINIFGVIIVLPFINKLISLTKKMVKGDENIILSKQVENLDEHLALTNPFIALELTKNDILKLKEVVYKNVVNTKNYLLKVKKRSELKEIILSSEAVINDTDKTISNNLRLISQAQLSDSDMKNYTLQSSIIKNYERIGDLSLNLYEFYEMIYDDKETFSQEAINELLEIYNLFENMFEKSSQIYFARDLTVYDQIRQLEENLDMFENSCRVKHFKRISQGICDSSITSSVYCDILSNLERMGDHCFNIAKACFKETDYY